MVAGFVACFWPERQRKPPRMQTGKKALAPGNANGERIPGLSAASQRLERLCRSFRLEGSRGIDALEGGHGTVCHTFGEGQVFGVILAEQTQLRGRQEHHSGETNPTAGSEKVILTKQTQLPAREEGRFWRNKPNSGLVGTNDRLITSGTLVQEDMQWCLETRFSSSCCWMTLG